MNCVIQVATNGFKRNCDKESLKSEEELNK